MQILKRTIGQSNPKQSKDFYASMTAFDANIVSPHTRITTFVLVMIFVWFLQRQEHSMTRPEINQNCFCGESCLPFYPSVWSSKSYQNGKGGCLSGKRAKTAQSSQIEASLHFSTVHFYCSHWISSFVFFVRFFYIFLLWMRVNFVIYFLVGLLLLTLLKIPLGKKHSRNH